MINQTGGILIIKNLAFYGRKPTNSPIIGGSGYYLITGGKGGTSDSRPRLYVENSEFSGWTSAIGGAHISSSGDKVIYDKNGEIKDIVDTDVDKDSNGFMVTNNTNDTITYCVVIERSPRTTVDVEYLRFLASAGNKSIGPTKLTDNLWKDEVSKALNINTTNYVLIKNSLEPYASENVNVMLWTDYDSIPNSEQDKYFYGTIKVYAWTQK